MEDGMRSIFLQLVFITAILAAAFTFSSCGGGDDDDDNDDASDDADDDAGDDSGDDDADDTGDDADDDVDDTDDDIDDDDDWSQFFPPPAGPLGTYRIYIDEAETEFSDIPVEVIGQDSSTFSGETYTVIQAGDFSANSTNGQKVWWDLSTEMQCGIKSSAIYNEIGNKSTKSPTPSFSITFDVPLVIEFGQAVGETRTHETPGTWDFGDATVESDFEAAATLVDNNATITVPFGEITGCLQVALAMTETGEDEIPYTVNSTFYLHPQYGIIKIEMVPGFFSLVLVNPPE
jgi:hypothetical protein